MGGNIRLLAYLGNGRIGERDRVRRRGLHVLRSIVRSRLQGFFCDLLVRFYKSMGHFCLDIACFFRIV